MSLSQETDNDSLSGLRTETYDTITVARSLKESKLYCKVRDNRKSIDLLTRRLGASFSKDRYEVRIYMDAYMIQNEREIHPERDPLDLLHDVPILVEKNCDAHSSITNFTFAHTGVIRAPDQKYGQVSITFNPNRSLPKILRYVLMAEMIWCIDDALVEMDLNDGVYR